MFEEFDLFDEDQPTEHVIAKKFKPKARPNAGKAGPKKPTVQNAAAASVSDSSTVDTISNIASLNDEKERDQRRSQEYGEQPDTAVSIDANQEDTHSCGVEGSDDASCSVLDAPSISVSDMQEFVIDKRQDSDMAGLGPIDETTTPKTNEESMKLSEVSEDGWQALLDEIFQPDARDVGATGNFQQKVHKKERKGKSVSFVLPDVSGTVDPMETHSTADENLNTSLHCQPPMDSFGGDFTLSSEEPCTTGEQHSNDMRDAGDNGQQQGSEEPNDQSLNETLESLFGEGRSSRKLRPRKKRNNDVVPKARADDELDNGGDVNPQIDEPGNESDDEYDGQPKQGRRKSKKDEDEKNKASLIRRKRSSKDSSIEEPQKKKLSHQLGKRRRRQVDKTLLEMPEEQINRRQISIRNLILLAEYKERNVNKGEAEPSASNQSNYFFDDEELENNHSDGTNHSLLQNAPKLNYHSYMNRSTVRWSKKETEEFYGAIRQFGTDFAMIQQLFPDRTRHQVKLKFKNEERKHPLQVHDALMHRSKDHEHFKRVIQQLQIQDTHNSEAEAADDLEPDEAAPENENAIADSKEEEQDVSWSDKEQSPERSDDTKHEEHPSAGSNDIDDIFDWY